MSDNVIFLQFKSPHTELGEMSMLACKVCRNKTYTLTFDTIDTFPILRCAACGNHGGRMGWSHDDDEKPESGKTGS